MMSKEDLTKLVADKAVGFLEYDDDHPDVGWGMGFDSAIDLAEECIKQEAARWNSLAALAINIDEEIRAQAKVLIAKKRR